MIVLKNVTKKFGKTAVLSDVSFRIDPGEFLCITGPSGAGKSTILSLLVGADEVTTGSVEVDGLDMRKVPPPAMQLFRRRVGFVFQDYKLLPTRTVEENVAFPLEVCGAPDSLIAKRVPETLKSVGLWERRKALPRELSGGEKARAAIARAIVHQPLIIMADELTGNLDPALAMEILKLFKEIHAKNTTVVLATHDASIVDALQTRVIRLDAGKVMRDSVGGYQTEKKRSRYAPEPGQHKVFTELPPDITIDAELPESKPSKGSKKIRITQISSGNE